MSENTGCAFISETDGRLYGLEFNAYVCFYMEDDEYMMLYSVEATHLAQEVQVRERHILKVRIMALERKIHLGIGSI